MNSVQKNVNLHNTVEVDSAGTFSRFIPRNTQKEPNFQHNVILLANTHANGSKSTKCDGHTDNFVMFDHFVKNQDGRQNCGNKKKYAETRELSEMVLYINVASLFQPQSGQNTIQPVPGKSKNLRFSKWRKLKF